MPGMRKTSAQAHEERQGNVRVYEVRLRGCASHKKITIKDDKMEGMKTKEPEAAGCEGKAVRTEPIQIRTDVECSIAQVEPGSSAQESDNETREC